MVVSRSPAASDVMKGKILMNNTALPLEDFISIFGVGIELRFNRQVSRICKTPFEGDSSPTYISPPESSMNSRAVQVPDQITSRICLVCLVFYCAHKTSTGWIKQTNGLSGLCRKPTTLVISTRLNIDAGALTVLHKGQVQQMPHLSRLRLPPQCPQRSTRMVHSNRLLGGSSQVVVYPESAHLLSQSNTTVE